MSESTNSEALILRLHVWFERNEQIFLGIGRAMLLDKIEQSKALDKDSEAELSAAIAAFKKSFA